jgi:hypothetical protein
MNICKFGLLQSLFRSRRSPRQVCKWSIGTHSLLNNDGAWPVEGKKASNSQKREADAQGLENLPADALRK